MQIEKDRILITGGCGFLGQHLANDLAMNGYRLVLFDVREDRSLLEAHVNEENCTIIRGDINNISELMDAIISQKAGSIIHTALIPAPESDIRPLQGLMVNLFGTCHVLEAARVLKLGRVTFISSGAVYDPNLEIKLCHEDLPFSLDMPMGLYGCVKASCEMIGLKYMQMFAVDFVSARCAGIYGPGVTANHKLMILGRNAVQGIKTEFKSGGDHRFEFIYINDVVQGVRKIHTAQELKHRVYNVGTGKNHSLYEIAEKVKKCVPTADISIGSGLMEEYWVERNPMDIRRSKEIGYIPEYDLEKGIAEFIKSFD